MSLKAAVVGGGNGTYAYAGDLALAGHEVRMCPSSPERHAAVLRDGVLHVRGMDREGEARLALVTEDPRAAVAGADVVISTDPAFTQERRAEFIGPHLAEGQVVLLSPGSLGGYFFSRRVEALGGTSGAIFAEPGTLPYLTRRTGPTEVAIAGRAVHLPIGVFPAGHTGRALELMEELFPGSHPVQDSLSAALLNVGPIIHSVLVMLNTGAIEHFDAWDIHNEGTTPSVKRTILAHDEERISLRRVLGYDEPHYPIRDHYEPADDREWMYGRGGHSGLVESEKWRESLDFHHRYIQEDVKYNLALMTSIGDLAGHETPLMDALLTLGSVLAGEDFRETGRTLQNLGLGGIEPEQLKQLLRNGPDRPGGGAGGSAAGEKEGRT